MVEFASLFRDEPTLPAELFEHVEPLTSAAFQSADLRTAKAGVQLFARLLAGAQCKKLLFSCFRSVFRRQIRRWQIAPHCGRVLIRWRW